MNFGDIGQRGLVLVGCGKMGSAILRGWLAGGLVPASVWALDPYPSDWLTALDGLHLNAGLPEDPALVLVAVKPQEVAKALSALTALGNGSTVFLSVVAGTPISAFEAVLGARTPIVRAMPNTPAAVGKGITALIESAAADEAAMSLAETLMSAVGQTVRLTDEAQMDAVTAVSGSGPAYVFHLIEALAAAGEAEGLPGALALHLAKATVAGAAALAEQASRDPAQLRADVTSPGGTTAVALKILMDEATGFRALLARAVRAATQRSRELGQ